MAKKKAVKAEVGELPKGKLALIKDPRVYAKRLPIIPPRHKRFLGLDLASNCGVTFCDVMPGQPVTSGVLVGGQWNLSIGNWDTQSIRLIRLKHFLEVTEPDVICYEEVKYTPQGSAPGMKKTNLTAMVARAVSGAQVVHSLQATLVVWAEERGIPCQSVPIGTLKKYATGRGNANKGEMLEACNEQFGTTLRLEDDTGDDNIADSMFLCAMCVQNYSEGMQ